jgi:aldehyde:ferredoxin oxidoreductase
MTSIEEISEFYSHFFGETVTREQVADIAWQCMQEEWEFNRRAGFGPEDDEMPDTMKEDPIGPEKVVWDIPQEVVNQAYQRFEPREELFTQKPS